MFGSVGEVGCLHPVSLHLPNETNSREIIGYDPSPRIGLSESEKYASREEKKYTPIFGLQNELVEQIERALYSAKDTALGERTGQDKTRQVVSFTAAVEEPKCAEEKRQVIQNLIKTRENSNPYERMLLMEKAEKSLSVLPVSMLELLKKNGYRFIMLKNGENPLDTGIIKTINLKDYHSKELQEKIKQLHSEFKPMIEQFDLTRNEAIKKLTEDPKGKKGGLTQASGLAMMQAQSFLITNMTLKTESKTDGNVAIGTTMNINALLKRCRASNSKEAREYLNIVIDLNPHFFDGGRIDLPNGISFTPIGNDYLFLPNYTYYHYEGKDRLKKTVTIHAKDTDALEVWNNGEQSLDDGRYNSKSLRGMAMVEYASIFLREESADEFLRGNNTMVHEAAHAIKPCVRKSTDPRYRKLLEEFETAKDEAYSRARSNKTFVTEYAKKNPNEFEAESIAAYFSLQNKEKLRVLDPEWYLAVEKFVLGVSRLEK